MLDYSSETEDTFIADFAVGLSIDQIKSSAPYRMSASYTRIIRIEEELGADAKYAGDK